MVDPYAAMTGYFKFVECGDTPQPVIAMELGVTYTFDQSHPTNWMHPLGFAYFADGAHKDVDELEPGISHSSSACAEDHTCQTPLYYLDGHFLGAQDDAEDFGLDVYEPGFTVGRDDFLDVGSYEVRLTLTDEDYGKDLFYFCHLHDQMSARIKVVDAAGLLVQGEQDLPAIPYAYHVPSAFDTECGTYDLDKYQKGNAYGMCEGLEFTCNSEGTSLEHFADCLWAMDCHMHVEMKNSVAHAPNGGVAFVHQMIPHHENAINMAKLMLKNGELDPEDEMDQEMVGIAWEIINGQNLQITQMRKYAKAKGTYDNAFCNSEVSKEAHEYDFDAKTAPEY